ncbi:MAG: PEP-CTERM sorting domain-containing protein [Duganella sp.]
MFSPRLNAVLLTSALALGAGAAHATTITFDDLPASRDIFYTTGYTFATDGYDFNVTEGNVWFLPARLPNSGYATNGTTSFDLGGIVTVTSAAHKPFSVVSMDLATVWAPETSTVRLTGIDVGGNQIIQTYTMSGANSPNPFDLTTTHLTGFNNLTSLVMELVYSPSLPTYFSLVDNIVINETAVSAVPEPTAWAMLGMGLAMIAGFSRRKSA